jgi:hypothetical protein
MYFMRDDQKRIFKSTADLQPADIRLLYDGFNSAIAELNCGKSARPTTRAASRSVAVFS